jgi:hypothetical protein
VPQSTAAERNEGKGPREAIFQACLLRFRPIMMTTMAAMLGALPLALGKGDGAELRTPLGPYLINRALHEREVQNGLRALDQKGGVQALVITGPENEAIEEFRERLTKFVCPQALNGSEPIDGDPFRGLIRIDEISAQRGFGMAGEDSDDEALEDLGDAVVDRAVKQREADGKLLFDLTHKRFSELMRPQFALVYASVQGRTLKEKICLMDVHSDKMTVRDLITAMSRPTKQSDLKVMSYAAQKNFLANVYEKLADNELDLRQKALEIAGRAPSERRTPSRVGR